jgi:hypothetical protein
MSVLIRFTPTRATTAQYDETIRLLEESGNWPAPGLEYHCCFVGPDGNVRVSEIWETREHFEAHGEHLMPILAQAGIELGGEPEFLDVYAQTNP